MWAILIIFIFRSFPFSLDQNLIVVVLGKAQNLLSPFEKIHRVNCQKRLKTDAGTLLFLSNAIQLDRYTLPTYIPPE